MALAIDASTPAYKSTTSASATSLTTASFTPPVGALLVVMFANSFSTTLQTAPTNTGGTVTWNGTAKTTEAGNGCSASVWLGVVTVSASMTVTAHVGTTANDWGFGVAVVTGQSATQNGATQVATSASGTPSGTIASLVGANSLVLGSVANFTNQTVGTPGTNQTLTFNGHAFSLSDAGDGAAIWAQFDTRMSLGSGSSDTINDTAPTAIAYSLAMCEIIAGAGSSPVWPPSNRVESTRNRAFFAVRRRPSIPVPLQDFLPQWRAPETPPLTHARLAAMLRGHRWSVVPPQIPVPPRIPGNRINSARSRIPAVRRGRQTNPVLTQTTAVAPLWVPQRAGPKRLIVGVPRGRRAAPVSETGPNYAAKQQRHQRRAVATPTRGRRTTVIADHAASPRQSRPPKPRLVGSRRGRQWTAPVPQAVVLTPAWVPQRTPPKRVLGAVTRGRRTSIATEHAGFPRRVQSTKPRLAPPSRGRRFTPTPAQIPVPLSVWPTRAPSNRSRVVAFRRGHRIDPAWPVTAAPSGPPTICYPTSAVVIVPDSSASVVTFETTTQVGASWTQTVVQVPDSSAASSRSSTSATAATSQTSASVPGNETSTEVPTRETGSSIRVCGIGP